jgi:hypothetical protein
MTTNPDAQPLTVAELTRLIGYNSPAGITTWHVCPACHMGVCRKYKCVACIREEIKQREDAK